MLPHLVKANHKLYIPKRQCAPGGDSGPFWMGCVNTILKEMGPFSASSEWHEWINFHSKWVSFGPVIQYGYLLPLFPIQDEPYLLL